MSKKIIRGCVTGCFIFVVLFILLIAGFIAYLYITASPSEYTDPKDYQIIKEKMVQQDEIKHFPAQIPENATEVAMYGRTDMPYNGETFVLEFKTNRQYIEKELSKYDFWNKDDKIGTKRKIYFMPSPRKEFNADDYTYYVIKELNGERGYKEFFPYYNGIGVDGKQNKILYYHIYPAD